MLVWYPRDQNPILFRIQKYSCSDPGTHWDSCWDSWQLRGSAMAVYSFIGFGAAFLAPLVFGVVLDLAGGRTDRTAWALAFVSIGIFGVLSPVARWLYRRYPQEKSVR